MFPGKSGKRDKYNRNGKRMQQIKFFDLKSKPLNILCLGAHSDDLEIGCGGSILRLIAEHKNLNFYWVVFSAKAKRELEAKESAALFLEGIKSKKILIKDFRDGFFPYIGGEIKEYFEELKKSFTPDLIFTHFRHDLHQDHRLISDLTWNTFRNHLILEYEIPKYDGDLGHPNFYISLEKKYCENKINNIMDIFLTQKNKHWLTEDTLYSLMRIRGIETGGDVNYAEAFYGRKLVY